MRDGDLDRLFVNTIAATFVDSLRETLERDNATAASLARAIGVDRGTLSRWFSGETLPTFEHFVQAAYALCPSLTGRFTVSCCFRVLLKCYHEALRHVQASVAEHINTVAFTDEDILYCFFLFRCKELRSSDPKTKEAARKAILTRVIFILKSAESEPTVDLNDLPSRALHRASLWGHLENALTVKLLALWTDHGTIG